MELIASLSFWVFRPEIWVILALLLIVSDVLIGLNFFVLPVGIAAARIAGVLFAEHRFWPSNTVLLEDWRDVLIVFAVLSVVCVFLVRKLFQQPSEPEDDINTY